MLPIGIMRPVLLRKTTTLYNLNNYAKGLNRTLQYASDARQNRDDFDENSWANKEAENV